MKRSIDYTGVNIAFYCHDGEGNYLFHRRASKARDAHGTWSCGAGGVKFNEPILVALDRELLEEFASTSLETEYLGWGEAFREDEGQSMHWIVFRYRVLVDRTKVINNEPEKHEELGWFKINNLPQPLHPIVALEVEEYKDKLV